ncbi:hypothetical protein EKO27_g10690 [Xylaria grammica]|uniref:RRM domain-containing protein n=1 Tax=Xylaria grammica TaxID=363999 RepID=A0A439CQH6_9PEZI|nr:hypothetical protein EKO27_g10690 [Xylaria grammica]
MTGNSPRVWAAADMDPVSPAPVHPSSPIMVPTLQDQADMYFDIPFSGSDSVTLAVETIPRVSNVDEQTHVPAAAVPDSTQNNAPDTRPVDLTSTDPDTAGDAVTERGGPASVGVGVENMREAETSQSDATEAEQDVSMSTESTPNPDVPAQLDITASTTGGSPSISQASIAPNSIPLPKPIPQPPHKFLEGGQIAPNGAHAQLSQPLDEQPLVNNHHSSEVLIANTTARSTGGDNDVAYNRVARSIPNGNVLPQSMLLPSKSPTPRQVSMQPYHPTNESSSGIAQFNSTPLPSSNGLALGAYIAATLGTADHYASATSIPSVTSGVNYTIPASQPDSPYGKLTADRPPLSNHQKQRWDAFLQDERRYVSDAKWDMFPDGSRIFIGNLSSERISKRDVFDLFSNYGRLAQISLKQAYGFVQYHTVAEGQVAMENLQGVDLGGKKINLELSRTQKKDGEGNRTNRGKRDSDRQDGNRGRREDYRPSRLPSPRRSNHQKQPSYNSNKRGRSYQEGSYPDDRRRSQSPGSGSRDLYRRRSVSPYHQHTPVYDTSLHRRYGARVPDVLFLVRDVTHDFVSWVQDAFSGHGLIVEIMYLGLESTRDEVVQHHAVEGVRAVVDLDPYAQESGRVSLQVFDRSNGPNVRYDKYQDLPPAIAARIIDAKSRPQIPTSYQSSQYVSAQYGTFTQGHQGHYMPPSYPNQNYPSVAAPGTGSAALDPTTIGKILGLVNGPQGVPQTYKEGPPVDVDTLLANLGTVPHPLRVHPPNQHSASYMNPQPNLPPGVPRAGDSARQVQDILTRLTRPR